MGFRIFLTAVGVVFGLAGWGALAALGSASGLAAAALQLCGLACTVGVAGCVVALLVTAPGFVGDDAYRS